MPRRTGNRGLVRWPPSAIALVLALLSTIALALLGDVIDRHPADPPPVDASPDRHHWQAPEGREPVNSVDTIIADMSLPNDARLAGIPDFPWASAPNPAALVMATDPRGCRAPGWWLQSKALAAYKDCEPWRGFVQWYVIYEGEGNAADNVRVQVRGSRSWYLSRRQGRWLPLVDDQRSSWFLAAKQNIMWVEGEIDIQYAPADSSNLPRGADLALRVERGAPHTYHGVAGTEVADISQQVDDLAAIFTTAQARLVKADADGPDDLNEALWLFQSGADFYPHPDARPVDFLPPGVGVSRSRKITREWQAFNFATLDVARQDYPGASRAISAAQLRANPPPL